MWVKVWLTDVERVDIFEQRTALIELLQSDVLSADLQERLRATHRTLAAVELALCDPMSH